ncbi:MAG: TRAP transporter substrate-binding protein DctP [Deltaproteobacteria bacterium]|nr:TRAP transporter substrate-binding protein DctP [Deltaproteobacteria bacterium]
MKRSAIFFIFSVLVIFISSLITGGHTICQAADTIKLTYGSFIGENHYFATADKNALKKIEQETNNRVKFQTFFGGSLISTKESYEKLMAGVADVANVSIVYAPGFDLSKQQRLFWYGCDDVKAVDIYHKVLAEFPDIEKEWSDIMVTALTNMPSFQLITTKPVRRLADLKGMKLKTTPEMIASLNALGAEGISVPVSELYISLQKGIINGAVLPYDVFKTFKLTELCKYTTRLNYFLGPYPTRAMNLNSLNRLPKDIQGPFRNIRQYWSKEVEKGAFDSQDGGIQAAKAAGVEFIEFPPDELKQFYKLLEKDALVAAKKLDDKGLPGTALFQAIRKHLD